MAYSCGYWTSEDPSYTVQDAQRDKLDLVCRKLGLAEGQRFLDVGCGWGSLSLHAAEHYGVHVTGVTLSKEQRAFVLERVRERGLGDRVEIRLQDYRDVPDAPFDAVASIEMGEHVGEENYPTYAATLHRLVKPHGRVLVQQMSRRTRPGGGPFIESYIAPDMSMRPVGRTVDLLEDAGLEVRDVHALREHYVRTVAGLVPDVRGELGHRRRPGRRGGRPGVAALPRRWRAGVRGGPDGRRPDPRRAPRRRRHLRHAVRASLVSRR